MAPTSLRMAIEDRYLGQHEAPLFVSPEMGGPAVAWSTWSQNEVYWAATALDGDFWQPTALGALEIDGSGRRGWSQLAGDFDGDGGIEILLFGVDGVAGGQALVSPSDPGAGLTPLSLGAFSPYRQAVDLDGDGDLDIVSLQGTFPEPETAPWLENDDGVLVLREVAGAGGVLAAVDMDGDGDLDIVERPPEGTSWWENLGRASAWMERPLLAGLGGLRTAAVPADVDGDGDLDLVGVLDDIGCTRVWRENLDLVVDVWLEHSIGGGSERCAAPVLGDLDGDGALDVGWPGDEEAGSLTLNRLASGGGWLELPAPVDSYGIGPLVDVDEDGSAELLLAEAVGYESPTGAFTRNSAWSYDPFSDGWTAEPLTQASIGSGRPQEISTGTAISTWRSTAASPAGWRTPSARRTGPGDPTWFGMARHGTLRSAMSMGTAL